MQSDLELKNTRNGVSAASAKLLESVIHSQVVYRLYTSLDQFFKNLVTLSRFEPQKFASLYYQAVELSASVLKDTGKYSGIPFGSHLKAKTLNRISDFLTFTRDPIFLSSTLLSLSSTDLDLFLTGPRNQDLYENLASLGRAKPIDIIFNGLFPSNTLLSKKEDYFSIICAKLLESKRGERICFAIFDKFMDLSGAPSASALELVLITILQDGAFLTLNNAKSSTPQNSQSSSSPIPHDGTTTSTTSPDNANLVTAIPIPTNSRRRSKNSPTLKSASLSLGSSVDEGLEEKMSLFLEKSVNLLFEYLDSSSVESIPRPFLNFIRLTVSKLQQSAKDTALLLIIVKYLFHRYLQRMITNPEQIGILKDFYLTEGHRQKILAPVFDKLYKLMVSAAYYYDQSQQQTGITSARAHLNGLVDRLSQPPAVAKAPSSRASEPLLTTSLVVLSPSDVYCLFKALFPPARRPSSGGSRSIDQNPRNVPILNSSNSYTSSASTVMSIPVQPRFSGSGYSPYQGESFSSISYVSPSAVPSSGLAEASSSSMTGVCGKTMYAGALVQTECLEIDVTGVSSVPTPPFLPTEIGINLEEIKHEIEPAIDELATRFPYIHQREQLNYIHSLRPNKSYLFKLPGPFNEKWQAFRLDDSGSLAPVFLDNLVENHTILPDVSSTQEKSEAENILLEKGNILTMSNKTLLKAIELALDKIVHETSSFPFIQSNSFNGDFSSSRTYLVELLQESLERSMASGRFLDSNDYSMAIQCLKRLLPSSENDIFEYEQICCALNNYLILCLSQERSVAKEICLRNLYYCKNSSLPFSADIENCKRKCDSILEQLSEFRAKVWYSNDVRTTPLWHRAREVALSLTYPYISLEKEAQAQSLSVYQFPIATSQTTSPVLTSVKLERNNSSGSIKSSAGSGSGDENRLSGFSFRRFTGGSKRQHNRRQSVVATVSTVSEGMFAPRELAGDYKLSDRESEATKKWIEGQSIQNFCAGEERIMRFCCEVDDLVKRVMGDTITSKKNRGHSILSSSSLYRNDIWKTIIELEGPSRVSSSSVATTYSGGMNPHKRYSMQLTADNGDAESIKTLRRQSVDGSMLGADCNTGHRSQKSSPNILEMFSSLDFSSRRSDGIVHDIGSESTYWSDSSRGVNRHRRNKSLSEVHEFEAESDLRNSFHEEEEGAGEIDARRQELDRQIFNLQMRLTSFIYTDLGMYCWNQGSETDKWLNDPLVQEALEYKDIQRAHFRENISTMPIPPLQNPPDHPPDDFGESSAALGDQISLHNFSEETPVVTSSSVAPSLWTSDGPSMDTPISAPRQFHIEDAYKRILQRLSVNPSPLGKLNSLHELVLLVVSSLSSNLMAISGHGPSTKSTPRQHRSAMASSSTSSDSPYGHRFTGSITERFKEQQLGTGRNSLTSVGNLPTALTCLGETIATVEAKRSSSLGQQFAGTRVMGPNTDAIAEEIRRVLETSGIKSNTLFRDLQFIAAFVPPHVLDMTDMGKAFWDVSLAALSLKEEMILVTVDYAQAIFQTATGMLSTDSTGLPCARTFRDCSQLWYFAAREGDFTSQRELALMLMSHPESTPLCLMPFSKLSNVFESSLTEHLQSWDDPDKADPVRMAVIRHLMSTAAAYGDPIAAEYLIQTQGSSAASNNIL